MQYKLTTKVLDLVQQLIEEGYEGEAALCRYGCSGTQAFMDDGGARLWIELTGFSKETLNLVEDVDVNAVVAIGRYSHEGVVESVQDIVRIAWEMFDSYEGRGYSLPVEFKELFKKYGYIEEKQVTTTKIVRKK